MPDKPDKRTHKVRLRTPLPAAMPALDWLDMVLDRKPAVNRLGAVVNRVGGFAVVAWLGREVHIIPLDRARPGDSLHASLPPEQRVVLEGWLAGIDAGKYDQHRAKWLTSIGW
jgi:hypothetical protein